MKTFEEWWEYFRAKYPTATEKCCASMAWAVRDEEISALQRQLEPSPCGTAGIGMRIGQSRKSSLAVA